MRPTARTASPTLRYGVCYPFVSYGFANDFFLAATSLLPVRSTIPPALFLRHCTPLLWVGFGLSVPIYFTHEATSMRKPAANSPTAPIQTSAFPKDESQRLFISSRYRTSPLVKTFNPFGEMAFVDPPLATDFESRQLFAVDHTLRGSLGYLQHGSGLFKSQTPQRLVDVILRRGFHASEIEQRQCHDGSKCGRPFVGKSSRVAFRLQ